MDNQNYILLNLPSKVEYALLALLEMASQSHLKHPLTVNEITAKQPIPERYLEQILATLRRGGLLKSQRGSKGGYVLAREPQDITLLEIVSIIEGNRQVKENTDLSTVEMKLIQDSWHQANQAAQSILEQYTLLDLCKQRESYLQQGLMYYI
ncbi:transcriptional regulator, BadM/Rrf2 family [Gloeothece citriformis PCC 7424]|uniref:Transcriptional regulator, BadM/Rrf2 family n=1 Tax=Gloeothece citriformis (strain PCC 7424) TaxID=65393 RepID=B7KLE6_GLOC7|nr:Rrf2 family transcriptional regulator [Gloeothece citriformis]ACK72518.1 transcriptional regulator, BadM/Rrf2 family [Gloeothece citriformis PCC 7424]